MNSQFPFIEVAGTHEDIGYAIGSILKNKINHDITAQRSQIPNYATQITKSQLYYDYTKTIFPQFINELDATARAAGVDKFDYFLSNNREVYDVSENYYSPEEIIHDHCTVAVSFNLSGAVIGHNEDWVLSALDSLYLLKATVNGTTFFSLNYAGAIPGVSAGINNWGLIQCINDLYQTNQFGIPKNFLARAILECKTISEAENIISKTKRASGFNHVLVQGKSGLNIEIAGDDVFAQPFDSTFVHTNHYLSSNLIKVEKFHTISSEARYSRACELVKPNMSVLEMQSLLSDTQNSKNPICRPDETIASLAFDTANNHVFISRGHPCSSPYQLYKPF